MNVQKVVSLECGLCGERYDEEASAEKCCMPLRIYDDGLKVDYYKNRFEPVTFWNGYTGTTYFSIPKSSMDAIAHNWLKETS